MTPLVVIKGLPELQTPPLRTAGEEVAISSLDKEEKVSSGAPLKTLPQVPMARIGSEAH